MNNITITGNVGRDPELKFSQSGMAVVKFSVADTSGKDDNKKTQWWNIVCFGDLGENVAASINKGTRVQVIGKVQKEKYTGNDGVEKERTEVLADDVGISLRWQPAGDAPVTRETAPTQPALDDEEPF